VPRLTKHPEGARCTRHAAVQFGAAQGGSAAGPKDRRLDSSSEELGGSRHGQLTRSDQRSGIEQETTLAYGLSLSASQILQQLPGRTLSASRCAHRNLQGEELRLSGVIGIAEYCIVAGVNLT
jgi:hypothetical protein